MVLVSVMMAMFVWWIARAAVRLCVLPVIPFAFAYSIFISSLSWFVLGLLGLLWLFLLSLKVTVFIVLLRGSFCLTSIPLWGLSVWSWP